MLHCTGSGNLPVKVPLSLLESLASLRYSSGIDQHGLSAMSWTYVPTCRVTCLQVRCSSFPHEATCRTRHACSITFRTWIRWNVPGFCRGRGRAGGTGTSASGGCAIFRATALSCRASRAVGRGEASRSAAPRMSEWPWYSAALRAFLRSCGPHGRQLSALCRIACGRAVCACACE